MELEFPEDLKYLDSHEYIRLDGETATIGISAYALEQLGDVVFLELPEVGDSIEMGEVFGAIESVKAAEDLYAPASGNVIDRNEQMLENPELIADDPYGDGWLLKVSMENPDDDLENTLSASEYRAQVEGEE